MSGRTTRRQRYQGYAQKKRANTAAKTMASPKEIAYNNLRQAVKMEIANIMEYGTEREDFIANGGIKRDNAGNEMTGRTHKGTWDSAKKRRKMWNSYVAPQSVVPEDMARQMLQLHEQVHGFKSPNEVNGWKESLEAAAEAGDGEETPEAAVGGRRKRRKTRRKRKRKRRKTRRKKKRKTKRKRKRKRRRRRTRR